MEKSKYELDLETYLAGLTEKKARVSDNKLIAMASPEKKKALSNAHKGRVWSKEQRTNNNNAKKGKILTEEHRRKIKEARAHQVFTDETRAKLSIARKGMRRNPFSKEWCENISKGKKGKPNPQKAKPVIVPWGVYRSGKLAGDAYNQLYGTKNACNKVSHHCKRGTDGYQFISIEEYIMLTGKEL